MSIRMLEQGSHDPERENLELAVKILLDEGSVRSAQDFAQRKLGRELTPDEIRQAIEGARKMKKPMEMCLGAALIEAGEVPSEALQMAIGAGEVDVAQEIATRFLERELTQEEIDSLILITAKTRQRWQTDRAVELNDKKGS